MQSICGVRSKVSNHPHRTVVYAVGFGCKDSRLVGIPFPIASVGGDKGNLGLLIWVVPHRLDTLVSFPSRVKRQVGPWNGRLDDSLKICRRLEWVSSSLWDSNSWFIASMYFFDCIGANDACLQALNTQLSTGRDFESIFSTSQSILG